MYVHPGGYNQFPMSTIIKIEHIFAESLLRRLIVESDSGIKSAASAHRRAYKYFFYIMTDRTHASSTRIPPVHEEEEEASSLFPGHLGFQSIVPIRWAQLCQPPSKAGQLSKHIRDTITLLNSNGNSNRMYEMLPPFQNWIFFSIVLLQLCIYFLLLLN